jgi:hypothetical protein
MRNINAIICRARSPNGLSGRNLGPTLAAILGISGILRMTFRASHIRYPTFLQIQYQILTSGKKIINEN